MVLKLAKKTPVKAAPAKKVAAKKVAPKKLAPRRVDEDEAPTPTKKKAAAPSAPTGSRKGVVTSGWDGAKGMGGSGDFIKALDFKNEADRLGDTLYFVGKFIDDEPYANVKIHWTDRKGKRSFVCIGDDCPLCDIGADVKTEMRFNFAVFTDDAPKLRSWAAGWKIFKKIEQYSIAPLTKPLSKRYYLATRTGKTFNEIAYDLQKVTADEIAEGYPDIYVPTAEEIAELGSYSLDDVVKEYSTMEELEEVAAEIVEG